jgi:hypothetical protein
MAFFTPYNILTGGRIPSDGTPIVILNTYYAPIYIIYDIAVVIGIGFAIVCLLFNFIFRNRKLVFRASID